MAAVLKPRHGYLIPLSWRMVPASVRHTSFFGVRPRSGHLQAIGCTRWLLDGCFTTMDVPAHAVVVAFLFLWECRLLLCCCIAQLLSWLVICVSRVTCDFVSRMGGRDTNNLFKGRLIETSLGGLHFCGSGAQNLDMETFTTVLAHGTSLSSAHVVFWGQAPVRTPPSKWLHEMAT